MSQKEIIRQFAEAFAELEPFRGADAYLAGLHEVMPEADRETEERFLCFAAGMRFWALLMIRRNVHAPV